MELENITVTQIILYTVKLLAHIEEKTGKYIPSFESLKDWGDDKGFPKKFLLRSAIIHHLDTKLGENDIHVRRIALAFSASRRSIIDIRMSHSLKGSTPNGEFYFYYLGLADSLGKNIPFEKEPPRVRKSKKRKRSEPKDSNSHIKDDYLVSAQKILADLLVFSKMDTIEKFLSMEDRGCLASFRTFALLKFQKSFPKVSYQIIKIIFAEIKMKTPRVDLERHKTLFHKINDGDSFAQWHRKSFQDFMIQ